MADTEAVEILDALMRNMRDIISTKTIVGEPIINNGITILPLMRVALGFGAGAGGAATNGNGNSNGNGKGGRNGGGGGGGVSITPVGFLVVDQNRAMMITPKSSKWDSLIESVPDLIERLTRLVKNKGDSSKESPTNGESVIDE
jgi:uncharacterized spore protein YtfJ